MQQAGSDEPLGPRQQPHEGEPEDDEHEAGDALEQELVAEEAVAHELGADAEQDEDGGEPEHEGDARHHHPPGRALLPEPFRLDGGHRRQVAGHEWEHARCQEGDEAREERDR